jgi:hypothetical protein
MDGDLMLDRLPLNLDEADALAGAKLWGKGDFDAVIGAGRGLALREDGRGVGVLPEEEARLAPIGIHHDAGYAFDGGEAVAQ